MSALSVERGGHGGVALRVLWSVGKMAGCHLFFSKEAELAVRPSDR